MIYVDNAYIVYRGMRMCHLMSDQVDNAEIHDFANKIGLKREWFHQDHYDISQSKRTQAIAMGAVETTSKHLVQIRNQKKKE